MTAELFIQVKRKLNITWEDKETDERVEEIIASAIPDLIHRLGISDPNFDFSKAGDEHTLFLNRCWYEWNHVLNEFYENYARMIATVQKKHEVKNYLENGGSESEE